ncbi:hypothetical protein ACH50O_13830 [Methylomonas sp. 2BW1-5-20]|uniref:hypothetical protein n=1 Tax=Methylomonas sp. 2BW1-5-20 TaxID=3376686 RepID=UPI00404F02AC
MQDKQQRFSVGGEPSPKSNPIYQGTAAPVAECGAEPHPARHGGELEFAALPGEFSPVW